MTDADVVEALEAVADAEERRVADEKLRRALRDLGAQVSPFITTKIPTEFEDDDTVAPWADFTPENQAAKLAELEAFNSRIPAPDASAMPPPPPVPKSPPRVSQSPGQFRTPPGRPACPAASPSSGPVEQPSPVTPSSRGSREVVRSVIHRHSSSRARRRLRAAAAAGTALVDGAVASSWPPRTTVADCARADRRHPPGSPTAWTTTTRPTTRRVSRVALPEAESG